MRRTHGLKSASTQVAAARPGTPARHRLARLRTAADGLRRPAADAGLDVAAEDHLAGGRLQHAGDDDVDGLADHLARVVDDDHRPVVEIGDALVVFLAFLEDEHLHDLAGQDHRLERVGELVDVQHVDAAQLRDLVQVEVVGDDLSLQRARQLDQLQIDFADVRENRRPRSITSTPAIF